MPCCLTASGAAATGRPWTRQGRCRARGAITPPLPSAVALAAAEQRSCAVRGKHPDHPWR